MFRLILLMTLILILAVSVDVSYQSSVYIQFDKKEYQSSDSIIITVFDPNKSKHVEIKASSSTGLNYMLNANELEDQPGIFEIILPISLFHISDDDVITASYSYIEQTNSVIVSTQAKIIKINEQIILESSPLDIPLSLLITNEKNIKIDSANSGETIFIHATGPGMLILKLSHITEGLKLMKWNSNTIDVEFDLEKTGIYQVSLANLSLNVLDKKIIQDFFVFPAIEIFKESEIINSTKLYNGVSLDDSLLFQSHFTPHNQTRDDITKNQILPVPEQQPLPVPEQQPLPVPEQQPLPVSEQQPLPVSEQQPLPTTDLLSNQPLFENKPDLSNSSFPSVFMINLSQNYISIVIVITIIFILIICGIIQFRKNKLKSFDTNYVTILNNKKNIAKISSCLFKKKYYLKLLEEQFPNSLSKHLLDKINSILYNLSLLYSSTKSNDDNSILQNNLKLQIGEFSQKMNYFKQRLFSSQLLVSPSIVETVDYTASVKIDEITYITNVEIFIKDYSVMLAHMKHSLSNTDKFYNNELDQILYDITKKNKDKIQDLDLTQEIDNIEKINNCLKQMFVNCGNLTFQ